MWGRRSKLYSKIYFLREHEIPHVNSLRGQRFELKFFIHIQKLFRYESVSANVSNSIEEKCLLFLYVGLLSIKNMLTGLFFEKWYLYNHFFDKFCNNFLSHTHIIFLLSLSIALVFVSIPYFLCKSMVVS